MHDIRDVNDYVRRLLVAVLLCPVAVGAWLIFIQGGFTFDGVMAYLGSLGHQYAVMGLDEQAAFRFMVYAVWSVLAFGFMILSFAISPPHFTYRLKKVKDHWTTEVVND